MEFPKLKKIYGLIPESLFEQLRIHGILANNFDRWLTEAINEKLEIEGEK